MKIGEDAVISRVTTRDEYQTKIVFKLCIVEQWVSQGWAHVAKL